MPPKKQEIQLQREIETQEEWEEVMAMEGLWVVDVYQEWCGPCQALVGNFRRLKNELGDNLLNFAIAKADTIDALEKYRGRCEPTFLFYAGGILTSFIHGANSPKVQRVITEQLAHEHKVLEGTAERKEVKDSVMTRAQEIEDEKMAEEAAQKEAEASKFTTKAKGVTVAIIKPDAVAQGKADEIKEEMKENGIEILAEEERTLSEDEAREIYSELQDEEYFDELIKFITSGPSHLLVLTRGTTGETVVRDWRDMIGPTNVEEAKENAPDSLRAKYGEKGYMNALHGSSSADSAAKELAFFFPNLAIPTYQKKKENIQRTLALIRPQAFSEKKDEILNKINEAGFKIAMYKEVELTKEQAAEFYKEHEQFPYFESLVETMSCGPLLALGLARDEAISAWREMLGPANIDDAVENAPNSLRAQYNVGDSGINMIHGSDTEENAKKELDYFFPMEQTVAVIKPAAMGTKDAIIEKIHEAGFRIAARKETTITKDIAEILYPHCKDKEFYDDLVTSMTSGPTMFMVLSREGAIDSWRRELGEVDPEQAKATNPNSLRAQFGQDVLNNAVHGSSNQERAEEEMKAVFGSLAFNPDGTVQGEQPELDEAVVDSTEGDTTMDQTSIDPTANTTATAMDETTADETQDMTTATGDETADTTTMDQTADLSTVNETMDETAAGDATTDGETTAPTDAETAAGEETTQAETTTAGDETAAEQTTADQTTADQTTADETTADTTTAADETTVTATETQGEDTTPATEETPAAQEEEKTPAQEPEPAATEEKKEAETNNEPASTTDTTSSSEPTPAPESDSAPTSDPAPASDPAPTSDSAPASDPTPASDSTPASDPTPENSENKEEGKVEETKQESSEEGVKASGAASGAASGEPSS